MTELIAKKIGTLEWVRLAPETLATKCAFNLELRPLPDRVKAGPPSTSNDLAYVIVTLYATGLEMFMPVTGSDEISFKPQEGLLQRFVRDRPIGGSFEHSFSELNKITTNYQSLEINKFDPILEAEQNRTGESFEAFGVKFPAEATTRWGILVILAVQTYFWIHLHELARKLQPSDPGWEVAFIGMYSSLPSQIVYSISALALPVCAVAALGVRGLFIGGFRWMYWLMLITGTLSSLTLAVAGWRSAPRRSMEGS
jgi:hypothetical protein